MVIGETEIAFFISSAVMFAFVIPALYKLYKRKTISRGRKAGYTLIFPSLTILGGLSIFVFQFFMDWREVIMFNGIWVLIYVFLLQDLAGSSLGQKFPIGKAFLAVGFTVIFVICSVFVFCDVVNFMSLGEWIDFEPLPIFIVLTIITILTFILAVRFYGTGEEEFTGGDIQSGSVLFIYMMVTVYGLVFFIFGLPIYAEDSWIPTHVQNTFLIIGIIMLVLAIPLLIRERQKRVQAGWGR
ncbi:MAG TPA: hypothetical protein VMV49_04020 [Candidatus Deferrimicrobium sp.]|nr:hypothetical protein [Candidatus Deferrimicrobium sp.]